VTYLRPMGASNPERYECVGGPLDGEMFAIGDVTDELRARRLTVGEYRLVRPTPDAPMVWRWVAR
jgi:hypothetical protein